MSDTILMRHPETPANYQNTKAPDVHRGVLDDPSTFPDKVGIAEGKKAAAALVAQEHVTRVFAGPLTRTRIIARDVSVATGVPVVVAPPAQTWNTGSLPGTPIEQAKPLLQLYAGPMRQKPLPTGGETFVAWAQRWIAFFAMLLEAKVPGVTVVCTQGTNIAFARAWFEGGRPADPSRIPFDYSKVEELPPGDWQKFYTLGRIGPVEGFGKVLTPAMKTAAGVRP